MIDFEKEFQTYLHEWMKKSDVVDASEIDDMVPVLYEKWLTTPSEAFLSIKPVDFFKPIEDPTKLMEILGKYIFSDISVPGPLLNEIGKHEEEIYPLLLKSIESYNIDDQGMEKFIIYCIELIDEMDKNHPLDDYIRIIKKANSSSNIIEVLVEILRAEIFDLSVHTKIKNAYVNTAFEFSKDCFLDLLSELPFDDGAYDFILECFETEVAKSGLYAHMLAKIGNDACLDTLTKRIKDPQLNYFNYLQVKEALEELGGVCDIARDFEGDPYFDKISTLEFEDPKDEDDDE